MLPKGFHRIRHYGLLASGVKADNLALARKLLDVPRESPAGDRRPSRNRADPATPDPAAPPVRAAAAMRIIEVFEGGEAPHHRPTAPAIIRIDTS